MKRNDLAPLLDHSVLRPEATAADIVAGAAIVREWRIGCYCVQPWWVRRARAELAGCDAVVASVVGFPHGCDVTAVKAEATRRAIGDGAGEIDMVAAFGALRGGDARGFAADLAAVVRAAGAAPVKVILETAVITDDEKRLACRLVRESGAAFVKTSTGFHPAGGASVADVRLLRAEVGVDFGVKASGGIRTLADVEAMLAAGANRIGTSASPAILGGLA